MMYQFQMLSRSDPPAVWYGLIERGSLHGPKRHVFFFSFLFCQADETDELIWIRNESHELIDYRSVGSLFLDMKKKERKSFEHWKFLLLPGWLFVIFSIFLSSILRRQWQQPWLYSGRLWKFFLFSFCTFQSLFFSYWGSCCWIERIERKKRVHCKIHDGKNGRPKRSWPFFLPTPFLILKFTKAKRKRESESTYTIIDWAQLALEGFLSNSDGEQW